MKQTTPRHDALVPYPDVFKRCCQIGPDFPPNLATAAARVARLGRVARVGGKSGPKSGAIWQHWFLVRPNGIAGGGGGGGVCD